jgi:Relaxase/Mobilisation nuclease domain
MARRVIDLGTEEPILDITAYARVPARFTSRQLTQIKLTVRRTPEVMVKVSGGARTLGGVEQHMAYIGRDGELALEMDTGEVVLGKGVEREVVEDWNLAVDANRRFTERSIQRRAPPKLVYNLIFSMPSGTSPKTLLAAVRKLAVNEWQLQHRYVMALHTDSDHPHVHVVLMATDLQGKRLNIRKATLRSWRVQFAENLRELGIAANATERAVRGLSQTRKTDGIYRAARRGESTHVRDRRASALADAPEIQVHAERGANTLRQTRAAVVEGWRQVASKLRAIGQHQVADSIRVFLSAMPTLRTERELPRSGERDAADPTMAMSRDGRGDDLAHAPTVPL